MNFRQIRAFYATARAGTLAAASRQLNVSQPTLSQHIKELELRYGARLFDRTTAGLALTVEGERVMAIAERIMAAAHDLDETLRAVGNGETGSLRLGSDSPVHPPRILARMRHLRAKADVAVTIANGTRVERLLSDARIDAAIMMDPLVDNHLTYLPIGTSPLALVLPKRHRLSQNDTVDIAELAEETLLMREAKSKTRKALEAALAAEDIIPASTIELGSREAIAEGIAQGLGVGVYLATEAPQGEALETRRLTGRVAKLEATEYLVCPSDRAHGQAVRVLVDTVNSYAAELRRLPQAVRS